MQTTLALHGRLAACFLLAGVVGCTDGQHDDPSPEPDNGAPTASDATFSLVEDGSISGRLAALDPDGDELQLAIVAAPRSGAITLDGARFLYQPNPNFHGRDELTFIASDGDRASRAARVTFQVGSVDDAPQLGANVFSGPSGFRITGQLAASDVDGDTLTYSMPSPISGALIEMDSATGRFIFEPLPALAGDEIVPVAVVSNGQVEIGKVTLRLEAVSFAGTWQASGVRVDGVPCANFTLPIETDSPRTATFLEHEVKCGDDESTIYEPLMLQLDADSPSSLHASQYLPIGSGSYVHVAIAIEPIATKPNTYRYVETFSGAFDQVTTATLTRA